MRVQAALALTALLLVTVFISGVAFAQTNAEQSKPVMFRYDSANRGVSPEPLTVPLALNWKYTVGGQTSSTQRLVASPVADADSVYFFVGRQMYAVSRKTGSLKWDKPLELPDQVDSTPVVHNGTAAFGCRDGKVYFVDVRGKSGRISAMFDLRQQHKGAPQVAGQTVNPRVQSSPTYANGRIYFGADDGWVYALKFPAGQLTWEFKTKAAVKGSPAVSNSGVYVSSMDGYLYGLSETTGRMFWRTKLESPNALSAPVATGSKVVVAAGRFVYACDAGGNGYVRWRFEAKGIIVGAPAVSNSLVFFGDTAGKFYAIKLGADSDFAYWMQHPSIAWQTPAEPPMDGSVPAPVTMNGVVVDGMNQAVRSAPTVTGDVVMFRSGVRQVTALKVKDGALAWNYDLSETVGAERTLQTAFQYLQAANAMVAGGTGTGGVGGMGTTRTGGVGGMGGVAGAAGAIAGMRGTGTTRGVGGMTGATTDEPLYFVDKPVEAPLVLETEVETSPVAAGKQLYVLTNNGALYAFSQDAADGTPPDLSDPGVQVPGRGDAPVVQKLKAYKRGTNEADILKIRGVPPVYIRIRAFDEGTGINPRTLKVTQDKGGASRWEAAYDSAGGYIWAIYEIASGGAATNLPDGDYALTLRVSDWSGNEAKITLAFKVDNSLAPPGGTSGTGTQPGAGGGMMPGGMMPGAGGGMMPGGMMPGAGGGMMPGGMMPGAGGGMMPGMMNPGAGGGMMPGMMNPGAGGGMMPGMMNPGAGGGMMPGMPGMPQGGAAAPMMD